MALTSRRACFLSSRRGFRALALSVGAICAGGGVLVPPSSPCAPSSHPCAVWLVASCALLPLLLPYGLRRPDIYFYMVLYVNQCWHTPPLYAHARPLPPVTPPHPYQIIFLVYIGAILCFHPLPYKLYFWGNALIVLYIPSITPTILYPTDIVMLICRCSVTYSLFKAILRQARFCIGYDNFS